MPAASGVRWNDEAARSAPLAAVRSQEDGATDACGRGAFLDRPDVRYLPASVRAGWSPATNPYTTRIPPSRYPAIMARYRLLEIMAQRFHAAGVRLLIGTDAMNPGVVPGFSVHDELADLVAAGLTPYEALRAGTANAAEFLGVGSERAPSPPGSRPIWCCSMRIRW